MKNIDKMNSGVKTEFDRYVSYISKIDGVVRIYLFGSYAYGEPTNYSDIDLFVVLRDGVDKLKVMQGVSRGLCDMRIPLDVIADNISDFTELSGSDRVTLQREIKENGVVVYG